MKRILLPALLFVVHASACFAQTTNVTKLTANDRLTGNLKVPSGKTLTVESGGTLQLTGATVTGLSVSTAWADITGKPSEFTPAAHTQAISTITGLQTALDDKASLTGTYNDPAWLTGLAWSKLGSVPAAVTALGTAGIGTGVLTGNGSAFSYTATSSGGNFMSDAGKLARYDDFGNIAASLAFYVRGPSGPTAYPQSSLSTAGLFFFESASNFTVLSAATMTGGKYVRIPAVGSEGSPATLISNADTGTVTNSMLAGSIALSKLSISGTPDGSKYLRDDGTWQTVSSGATLSANTFTGIQTLPAGTVSAPALTLGDSGTGLFRSATNEFAITNNGTQRFRTTTTGAVVTGILNVTGSNLYMGTGTNYGIGSDGSTFTALVANGANVVGGHASHGAVSVISSWALGFSNAVNTTAPDCLMMRDAAAVLQFGRDAASPVAQTIKAHDASGTNIDGASLTISGGNSTGTGDDGDVILRSTMTGSSGSSANTQQTRAQVVARFKNLTEGAATDVVSIALASGKVTGGSATLTVWASDGTDHQTLTTQIRFGAVNKAGTVTATCNQTDGATAASTGTLTVTCDATTTGNNVILRANATSSLTQTILRSRIVITALNGDDTQVVTPQ